MDPSVPLVVPEVNPEDIKLHKGIIANPNCSTIQAVVALKPLKDKYGIKRVVYSTYQAVSGAGMGGYNDLENGLKGEAPKKFTYPIAGNLIPHIDVFEDNGYTKEEIKMIEETRKILGDQNLRITATTVRVPVFNSHSESINVELETPFEIEDLKNTLKKAPGIVVQDDPNNNLYPMPITATGKDEVFVGRIRRDESVENGVNLWVVSDNIRKGAATNTVQIAQNLLNISIRSDYFEKTIFEGSCVALVTPFTDDGINYDKLEELIEWHIKEGTDAILICGTTVKRQQCLIKSIWKLLILLFVK